MAGKKDYSVVSVIDGLTSTQASKILSEITKSKNKYAPTSRGTSAMTTRDQIGNYLQSGLQRLLGSKK